MNPHANNTLISRAAKARDMFNRRLNEGDEVIAPEMQLPKAARFVVTQITPNMDPKAQPNTVVVILTQQIRVILPADTPTQALMRVRTVEEIQEIESPSKLALTDGPGPKPVD